MYAIVDKNNRPHPGSRSSYKTSSGAKNSFNRLREVFMQNIDFVIGGFGYENDGSNGYPATPTLSKDEAALFRSGYYKWVFKSHIDPLDLVGKNTDPGFSPWGAKAPLTQEEAEVMSKYWHQFNDMYRIAEIDLQISVK